jgi:hypothetical protein
MDCNAIFQDSADDGFVEERCMCKELMFRSRDQAFGPLLGSVPPSLRTDNHRRLRVRFGAHSGARPLSYMNVLLPITILDPYSLFGIPILFHLPYLRIAKTTRKEKKKGVDQTSILTRTEP